VGSFLQVRRQGFEHAAEYVSAVSARAEHWEPVWEWAHTQFMQDIAEQFGTEGAHLTGAKWAPLNPAYARRKDHSPFVRTFGHYYLTGGSALHVPILQRTTRLMASLVQAHNPEHIKSVGALEAAFGSAVEYGIYHQRGSQRLPQRQIIALRRQFVRALQRVALRFLLTAETPG
jgi:hypothetical protein